MKKWDEEEMQMVRDGDESFGEYQREIWDHIDWLTAEVKLATNRVIAERAYFAALAGMCAAPDPHTTWGRFVEEATNCALETVRQWPAFMAEVDKIATSTKSKGETG